MYNPGLFHTWVPKPFQLLLLILLNFAVMFVSGIYVTNVQLMVGDTGIQPEYFTWANYCSTVGMGASVPLYLRVKRRFRTKEIMVGSLIVVAALAMVMGTTDNSAVLVAAAFLVGFFKMLAMMEVLLPMMMVISPNRDRVRFYSIFYPMVLGITQTSGYYLTLISYDYNWRISYAVLAAVALLAAMVCIVFQHNRRFAKKVPLYYVEWISMLLFSICFVAALYVFTFGRSADWFHSERIQMATVLALGALAVLLIRNSLLRRPYLSFNAFRRNNVLHGLVLLTFTGMVLAVTSLQTTFTTAVLKYNPVTNASLNLMMLPGIIAAGVLAFFWFRNGRTVKMYIFIGFAAMFLYSVFMYFSIQPGFSYNEWYLPMFLKGFGMLALFLSVWFYTIDGLEIDDMMNAMGLMMVWRSAFTLAIFAALFSWLQYRFQWESIGNLAVYFDGTNFSTAGIMGNMQSIQINAVMAAMKRIFGLVNISGIAILAYVLLHHFGKLELREVRLRRLLLGKSMLNKRRAILSAKHEDQI